MDTYTEVFGSGDEQYVEDELAKLEPKAKVPPVPHMTLGWMNSSSKPTYEEKELRKLWDFDSNAPVREGTLIWNERLKGWWVRS